MSGIQWTDGQKVQFLLRHVPWTIAREATEGGEVILRCQEIPDATGAGATDEEIEADFWESLQASLEAFVHFNQRPPVPRGVALPWEAKVTTPTPVRMFVLAQDVSAPRPEPKRTESLGFANQLRRPNAAVTA